MGRSPCCSKVGLHRGPWTAREDKLLVNYVTEHGEGHWRSLPKRAGLLRCGKSCRLRWMNYLRPDIKRGNITPDEDDLIIRLHSLLGNRWSLIAGRLPGRTDNEIKNYWNSHLSKRLKDQKCFSTSDDKRKRSSTNSKSNTEKKMKANQDSGDGDIITRTKVHLPKAVRVSSVSVARSSSLKGSGSPSQAGFIDTELAYNLRSWGWSGLEVSYGETNNLLSNEDYHHNLVYENVSSCQNNTATNDRVLDDIFEEYEQLLQTDNNHLEVDSFLDSLLL